MLLNDFFTINNRESSPTEIWAELIIDPNNTTNETEATKIKAPLKKDELFHFKFKGQLKVSDH